MNSNSGILLSHHSYHYSNIDHVHILCPYNFCSCTCSICNYCYACSCACHQINYNTISENDIVSKTLKNISNQFYRKKGNNNYSLYNVSNRTNINLSSDYLSTRINNIKLNKSSEIHKFSTNYKRRSLSEMNSMRKSQNEERTQNILKIKKSVHNNYSNNISMKSNYRPSFDKQSKISKKSIDESETNKKIRHDKPELNNFRKCGSSSNFNRVKRKIIEIPNNYKYKNDEDSEYFNNLISDVVQKNGKYRNYINSSIDNKIKKNYNNYDEKKTSDNYEINKSKTKIYSDTKYDDYNINNTYDYNYTLKRDIHENNYNKDRNKFNHQNKLINYKYLKQLQKLNEKLTNNKLKYNHYANDENSKFKDNELYDKINFDYYPTKKNIICRINSFHYDFTDKDIKTKELENMKHLLKNKNEEILGYKSKVNSLLKEIEKYKYEIKKLNNEKKEFKAKIKDLEKKSIYRKKSKENLKSNININTKYYANPLTNISNNKNDNDNLCQKKEGTSENKGQLGLSMKLNIKTDLNINESDKQFNINAIKKNISKKSIFAFNFTTNIKSILCFDYLDKSFSYRDYADFGNFQENYFIQNNNQNNKIKTNIAIYLIIENNFYIITGINCDKLFVYNSCQRTINKLCCLKNNHSNGVMINYLNDIICISGDYNKKVERYNKSKNEWVDLPELNIERCKFSACIIKNKYIFCLFGYNYPTKQYLNTIEFLDMENISSWKYLKYKNENLLSLKMTGGLSINYNDEKIIYIGGYNGEHNKPLEHFYQIILEENFEKEENNIVEKIDRKLKDIEKNKKYIFDKGYNTFMNNKDLYYLAFDNHFRAHIFQINNMAHDIFYLN